jgi:hypothetical protein
MNPTFSRAGSYPSIQAIALGGQRCDLDVDEAVLVGCWVHGRHAGEVHLVAIYAQAICAGGVTGDLQVGWASRPPDRSTILELEGLHEKPRHALADVVLIVVPGDTPYARERVGEPLRE